jgi:hypothetical protein
MTKRKLDSDTLGAKGEAMFDGFCADAGLVSNPSIRDRTGWDRIVEFPYVGLKPEAAIDSRPVPISCHVQVKTVWTGKTTCRLRLSAAERLAKDPKPTFVYILSVNPDLTAHTAHLIHLKGDALATILKRLRREHRDNGSNAKINTKTISLPLSLGAELTPTGEALKGAIETAVGGPHALKDYVIRKRDELATLGYHETSFTGNVTIAAASIDDVVDGFLGLKPLELKSFQHSETRFGIELPLVDVSATNGQLFISPTTPRSCRLICRRGPKDPLAVLDGEWRAPALPGLPVEHLRMMFRHPLLDVTVSFGASKRFHLKGNEEGWASGSHTPRSFLHAHRLIAYLSTPGALLEVRIEGMRPFEFGNNGVSMMQRHDGHEFREDVCARAVRLVELLALDQLSLTWAEIIDSHEDVAQCLALLDGTAGNELGVFETEGLHGTEVALPINFIRIFPLGAQFIAYSVVAMCRAEPLKSTTKWHMQYDRFGEICACEDPVKDYEAFQERVGKRSQIDARISAPSARLVILDGSGQEIAA